MFFQASKAANPVPKEAEKEAAAAVDDDGEAGVEDAEDGPGKGITFNSFI